MHKILIIDSDKLIRWSMQQLLLQDGYIVDTAAKPDEALVLLENNSYHLIVSEIEFSDGLGLEMLSKIRSLSPESCLLIISALAPEQVKTMIPLDNIGAILAKPCESNNIRATVHKILMLENNTKYSKSFKKEV